MRCGYRGHAHHGQALHHSMQGLQHRVYRTLRAQLVRTLRSIDGHGFTLQCRACLNELEYLSIANASQGRVAVLT